MEFIYIEYFTSTNSVSLQWFTRYGQTAWDPEFDSNSPTAKGETGDALFQPEQMTLSYMICKCLLMVLLTSSGQLRMCRVEGRIWGEEEGSSARSFTSYLLKALGVRVPPLAIGGD